MNKVIFILSLMVLIACNKDDASGDVITSEFKQIEIILPQGQWQVTHFYDNQTDHTSDFEGFLISFKEDGTVEAKTDLLTEKGTWRYKSTSANGEQLGLQFEPLPPFEKIAYNWNIVSLGISKVELSYARDGDQETKLLTISKLE